jgi:hypothetical protein
MKGRRVGWKLFQLSLFRNCVFTHASAASKDDQKEEEKEKSVKKVSAAAGID